MFPGMGLCHAESGSNDVKMNSVPPILKLEFENNRIGARCVDGS